MWKIFNLNTIQKDAARQRSKGYNLNRLEVYQKAVYNIYIFVKLQKEDIQLLQSIKCVGLTSFVCFLETSVMEWS